MTDHDPMCPKRGLHPADEAMMAVVVRCRCEEYARVRADERERVEKVLTEAWGAAKASWRFGGDTYWEGRMDALDYAIRIAGGEQP